ncbi:thiamine phosphate synthase [Gelidibacter maritimus]|uniref:Thiamine phosphate synthase n=1 Tax=Gelidibacter maritimus TaxID=2761487 RepID=A0A7W2R4Y2_9FLAO|nr:thiamine phosphate synthase [Gelidibacter maritimus]MBA6154334.1 thiamine phosphate synthase [Gelidibacter maritimus]
MIVLIAPKIDIENETQILNQLFSAGLECYHLAKPNKNSQEHVDFIKEIDLKFHNRIVLHHFHELTNMFDLKGIHFEEEQRRNYIETPTRYFKDLNLFGKTISSSFSELNDLVDSDFEYDYHVLSSIFVSGNQPNVEGIQVKVSDIDKNIIAKYECDLSTIQKVFDLGYKGVAVSEKIWHNNEPVASFTKLKAHHDAIRTLL